MYRLTAGAAPLTSTPDTGLDLQNFSHPRRARSPLPENARRPRSPPAHHIDDPMTCGAPDVQKSRPIRYAGRAQTCSCESRRPSERSARSVSPYRSERQGPPAHVRARTPPAPSKPYYDQQGFLTPPSSDSEFSVEPLRTRGASIASTSSSSSRQPEPVTPEKQEVRGQTTPGVGLRDGMIPGPHFFEQAVRRTQALRVDTTVSSLRNPTPPKLVKKATSTQEIRIQTTPSKPRKAVPSLCEYLSLEQLENLWSQQDTYKGTIEPPQTRSRFTPNERAQILEARRSRLPVHPALRLAQVN